MLLNYSRTENILQSQYNLLTKKIQNTSNYPPAIKHLTGGLWWLPEIYQSSYSGAEKENPSWTTIKPRERERGVTVNRVPVCEFVGMWKWLHVNGFILQL